MPKATKPPVPPLNRQARRNGVASQAVNEQTLRAIEAQATVPAEQVIGVGPDSDPKPVPSLAKPLQIVPARTLVHPDGRQYGFSLLPNGDVVVTRWQRGDLQASYTMPRPEGDYLWSRLKGQGFTQF